jgi:DNA-directed RNA polymerase specialized sigma24 family protein
MIDDCPDEEAHEQVSEELPNATPKERVPWAVCSWRSRRRDVELLREMQELQRRREDKEADFRWREFQSRHWKMIVMTAQKHISRITEAQLAEIDDLPCDPQPEGIATAVLFKAWEYFSLKPAILDSDNPAGFLCRMTTNLCNDLLRKLKSRKAKRERGKWFTQISLNSDVTDDEGNKTSREEITLPLQLTPEQEAAQKALARRVNGALERLPEDVRHILWLNECGLSFQEMAKALDVAVEISKALYEEAKMAFEAIYDSFKNPEPNRGGDTQ